LLIIAGTHDGSIQVWDQASKIRRFHLIGVHTDSIFSFEIQDNILISTGGPFVALWDLSTGELLQTYTCEDTRLFDTVLINDKILATGGIGGLIWLFDCKTRYSYLWLRFEDSVLTSRPVN
jgi:WD40 repeat protein